MQLTVAGPAPKVRGLSVHQQYGRLVGPLVGGFVGVGGKAHALVAEAPRGGWRVRRGRPGSRCGCLSRLAPATSARPTCSRDRGVPYVSCGERGATSSHRGDIRSNDASGATVEECYRSRTTSGNRASRSATAVGRIRRSPHGGGCAGVGYWSTDPARPPCLRL